MKFWKILSAAVLLFGAACSGSKKTAVSPRTLDTITVSANHNPLDIYRESAPRTWDIQDTRVALTFNYPERTADGRAWIRLVPYCCTQDSIVLDAKDMDIDSVGWLTNGRFTALPFTYADDQLTIRKRVVSYPVMYDTANLPGAPVQELYITYKARPYADTAAGGSAAISDARGLYFINTDQRIPNKPVQIWTQGESESNSHWMPTIDKPNERFTFQVALTVPDSFQTLSNGARISSRPAGPHLRTDTWRIDQPIQTYAAMFAIGKYSIVKDEWEGKEVSYYVEPEYAPYARQIFQHTPEMLTYFSAVTGVQYPWNKYSQIIARDYVSGAMENTTASLFGEFISKNDRQVEDNSNDDIVAHELFHQWFGDYVTFESWSNLTLSESFANYSEQLWRRYYYGAAWADELAQEDLSKYLARSEAADPELVRFHYRNREEMFDHVSYNKGGAILRYLHGLMGDQLFSLAMNRYLKAHALQSAEATQWRLAVEEATGRDWSWFFDQWYYRAGHPVLDVRYDYNDAAQQLTVTVRQRSSPDSNKRYQLPLRTAVVYGRNKVLEDWDLKKRTETFTYKYRNGVRPVVVPDCEHWLPGEIREDKKPAQWLAQFRAVTDYISKRRALSFAYRNFRDSATRVLFREALDDTMAGIRVHALNLLAREPLQESLRRQVAYLAVQDGANRVRAAAFACLGAWKVGTMKDEMSKAVADRSYAVAGAALEALYAADKQDAYTAAKRQLENSPKGALETAVWSIIALEGREEDRMVFEKGIYQVYGTRRIQMVNYISNYITHVKDDAVFREGLTMLDQLYRAEIIQPYRIAIIRTTIGNLADIGRSGKERGLTPERLARRRQQARDTISRWLNNIPDKAIYEALMDKAFRAP